MSKYYELQEMIEREKTARAPDLPIELLAGEDAWAAVLADIEPKETVAERRAGPMEFAGITVVIDPDLKPDDFKLVFSSGVRR